MSDLCILALSSRTATFLIAPGDTRFHLDVPLRWTLFRGADRLRHGTTEIAPLFLEDLAPDTGYRLETALGALPFRTARCGGLVEAADHGVRQGSDDNARALQAAIDAVPRGGTLRLPPGRLAHGPVFLRPDMTFWVPRGTELHALHDWTDWPILPAHDATGRVISSWEGLPEQAFAAPLTAIDCPGLILTGAGTIDAGGDRGDWWSWPKGTRREARRPRAVFLAWSDDVQVSGLTVRNAPSWTIHPYRCDGLTACALKIENPADSPNTDGFNPESCCDATLTGLHFSVGDDCIAVKAGKRAPGREAHLAPTRRLAITHCFMEAGHGGVVLGSEMSGEITDVTVARCRMTGTDRGFRVKTRRGRGGRVARVTLSDLLMEDVPTPVAVNAFYYCDPDGHEPWVQDRSPAPVDGTTPWLSDFTIERLVATGARLAGAALLGLPEAPITGVTLRGFELGFDPEATPGVPLMADGQVPVRHVPLIAENAEVTGAPRVLTEEATPC